MSEVRLETARPPKIFRLRAVTARINDIILDVTTKRFWVQAHLVVSKGGARSGHFYCELVDNDENGAPIARMQAVIWRSQLDSIRNKLRDAGDPDVLAGNREICALCSVSYHAVYGLKLQIHDVDPSFGEAQIDRNRRLILEQLKNEGILSKNKLTNLPAAALRIGLITAEKSAAYNDFANTLRASPFSFKVIAAFASMQGENMERQVLAAFHSLIGLHVDVICIVRGGGSQLDLAWFDNEKLARVIIASPVPVWVGIGHDIDVGVLDFVAHTSFKTPTAVAEALVKRLQELDDRIVIARDRLCQLTDRQVTLAFKTMERNVVGLLQGARKLFNQRYSALQHCLLRVKSAFETQCAGKKERLDEAYIQMRERSKLQFQEQRARLVNAESRLRSSTASCLVNAEQDLQRKLQGLRQGSRKHLAQSDAQLQLRGAKFRSTVEQATNRRDRKIQEQTGRLVSATHHVLRARSQSLEAAAERIRSSTERTLKELEQLLARRFGQFRYARYEKRLDLAFRDIDSKQQRLQSLRPEHLLRRGYSITRDTAGRLIRSVHDVEVGQKIFTELVDGQVQSIIEQNEERKNDE
jgi:exodeoxyribonuclease VII large subunit